MKNILLIIVVAILGGASACQNSTPMSGKGYGWGSKGTVEDSTKVIDETVVEPDGIPGTGTTYGTGTGVSGQTPSGTGAGVPNDGRSGVGIQQPINPK